MLGQILQLTRRRHPLFRREGPAVEQDELVANFWQHLRTCLNRMVLREKLLLPLQYRAFTECCARGLLVVGRNSQRRDKQVEAVVVEQHELESAQIKGRVCAGCDEN